MFFIGFVLGALFGAFLVAVFGDRRARVAERGAVTEELTPSAATQR